MSFQTIWGGTGNTKDRDNTEYAPLMGWGETWQTSETNRQQVMPTSGTFTNFRVIKASSMGTDTLVLTVRKNGAATDLTVTLTGSGTVFTSSAIVPFSAGDYICVQGNPDDRPVAFFMYWAIDFTPDIDNETILLGCSGLTNLTANYYSYLGGGAVATTASTGSVEVVFPIAGTLGNFYWKVNTAPSSTHSRTAIIYDASAAATTSTLSLITGTATTGNYTSGTIAVSVGGRYAVQFTVSGSPSASEASWGIVFTPTESNKFCSFVNDISVIIPDLRYNVISGHVEWFTAPYIFLTYANIIPIKLKDIAVQLSAATGSGKSRTVSFVGKAGTLATVVSNASAATTSGSLSIGENELLYLHHNSSGAPANSHIAVGLAFETTPFIQNAIMV